MKFIKIKREENNPKFFKKRETKGCCSGRTIKKKKTKPISFVPRQVKPNNPTCCRAACSVQRAACSVQRAACSVQRAACSVQRAACSVQRAARCTQSSNTRFTCISQSLKDLKKVKSIYKKKKTKNIIIQIKKTKSKISNMESLK